MKWPHLGNAIPQRIQPIRALIGRTVFKLTGWKLVGNLPNESKLVIVALPHSSNFDFILALSVIWGWGLKINFMAKHTLFKFPQGLFFRAVGGIPVDRRSAHGLVEKMTHEFNSRSSLILGIAPEGTRNSDGSLKAGFARIAKAASAPVVPIIVNYKTKTLTLGNLVSDLSDVDGIIEAVKAQGLGGHRRAPARL
ncbi:MAG: 1-acyl-sn-glycerol-3-phosphate acyltransferase [Luminiphilus sp.]|jgi:1-acyl-sn-glycerol-3-phosphate acyltransferase|uniref:Acyltransferase n=1 Tax=Candidatus Paraluminiphilus aquimaris TaxID=2518994 RepID=A0ABY6Q2V8_9GAMM|nr:1-acyl-sn-glycerol-3-phosphate acyltransferase [Candidatus Paraluminiphilus aquimaris]MAJ52906.1 acyltransferase [Halieaceae bacterium]MCH1459189.1 1-acyl-sn-glycerol-3-phosphate acyltransferase [Luminiphilus sp.]OUV04293.1 MAG: acyltransferase [Cellvibrionales bacterium TMED79]UZP73534.1 acyltransferase [Candidatus Paraluminiphilus aquimaris]